MDLAGPASLTDVVLPSLVNDVAALSRRLVLVLDDYHVISSPRIHESVTFLLDHQPDTLQLAVATRSEPPLPLGRLRVRRESVEVRASELRFTDETPEERLLSGETRGVILTAIERLSPAQRLVVTLRDIEGWTADEACQALEVSEGNQRVLLHRGRSKVRAALERHLSPAA